MLEAGHKGARLIDEMKEAANIERAQAIKHPMIDRLTPAGILERPAGAVAAAFDFEVGVFPGGDPLIHGHDPRLQLAFECGQVVLDRLEQNQQPGLRDYSLLLLPVLIADQIVLKTAEAHTVVAKEVPRLQRIPELPVDQDFVPITNQPFLARLIGGVEVAFEAYGHELGGEAVRRGLSQRSALLKGG